MEQTIIALLGFTIALIFYLDRGRRADHVTLRAEVHNGFAETNRRFDEHRKETREMFDEHRKETRRIFDEHRKETRRIFDEHRKETQEISNEHRKETRQTSDEHRKETRQTSDEHRKETRAMFKQLLDAILDLTRRVGRLEGRFDVKDPQLESTR